MRPGAARSCHLMSRQTPARHCSGLSEHIRMPEQICKPFSAGPHRQGSVHHGPLDAEAAPQLPTSLASGSPCNSAAPHHALLLPMVRAGAPGTRRSGTAHSLFDYFLLYRILAMHPLGSLVTPPARHRGATIQKVAACPGQVCGRSVSPRLPRLPLSRYNCPLW